MVIKRLQQPLLSLFILIMWVAAAYSQSADQTQSQPKDPDWKDGAFIDSAYLLDFNHPANDLFRSRSTAYKFDDVIVNMAAAYVRKNSSEASRWGMEVTLQAGQDSRNFGFSPTAPNLPGSKWLRHLGPTDASYLLPAGKGLTVQGGIFSSLIGYDSLYAKDNLNYTRPWMADFTPYLMMGVNASYPFNDRLTATAFVINGYFHLADANSVPSWGGQLAYKPDDHWTLKETVLIGPAQSNTAFEFWRFFSDTLVERKRDPLTIAFEYQSGTEQVAAPGTPRSAWVASQLPARWTISKRWSATVRPEVAWDNDGRWTGFAQTVKAVTTTAEYRFPIREVKAILRLEHRFDDSRGPAGGFFRGSETAGGIVPLTPSQHLLIFAAIFTFDGQIRTK
jgi:hypothetical protein